MRARIVLLASVASLLASAAQAQNQTSFNGLNSADLARFCIYNNTIFSLGSVICTGKTRGLKCIMGPQPTIFDRSALSAAHCRRSQIISQAVFLLFGPR
jgi:hypothetical protein